MKIPAPKQRLAGLIDDAHERRIDPPRPHLGASQLGHPCERWLWLSFRWAVLPMFDGRVLRLFRRGQMEEETVVSDLRLAGIDVQNTGKNQRRFDFGCHVSGSADGVIMSGVPESPRRIHLLEIKTHNKKSFDALEKQGVEKSKPLHFAQMQMYMQGAKVERALYFAVCKDDDRIYTERVKYDKEVADKAIAKGHRLALTERLPPPLSTDPSWYECKFCDAHAFCHSTPLTHYVNCRTCAHATPLETSTWRCERWSADGIPVESQHQACASHVLHPDLVPWQLDSDASSDTEAVYLIDGTPVRNGEADAFIFSSAELIANASACASSLHGDTLLADMRKAFDGRVAG